MLLGALGELLFSPDRLVFSSQDPQEVARDVSRIFKPHKLRVNSADRGLNARMHHLKLGNISVSRLEYGAHVEIDPGTLDDFFLVQIPLAGNADIACGNQRFGSTPHQASLISPTLPLKMRWLPGNRQICVRFERAFVENHSAAHLGHYPDRPLTFTPDMPLDTPGSRYFLRLLGILIEELAPGGEIAPEGHPLLQRGVGDQFAAMLLNALLYGHPHNLSSEFSRSERGVAPHFVRRAADYIRKHYREPITVETLASVTGASVRSLFSGFRSFRDCSPMSHLRAVRLDKARQILFENGSSDPAKITQVALECGFSHVGRFAASYRQRFGELPSQTSRFRRLSR